MLGHIKESTYVACSLALKGLFYLFMGTLGAIIWSNGLKEVGWVYKNVLPRVVILVVAYYLTPVPFIVACSLALLPLPFAAGITMLFFFYSLVRF